MTTYPAMRTALSRLLRVPLTDVQMVLRIWHVRHNGKWVEVDPSIVVRAERAVACAGCALTTAGTRTTDHDKGSSDGRRIRPDVRV